MGQNASNEGFTFYSSIFRKMNSSLIILLFNAIAYSLVSVYFFRRLGLSIGLVIWGIFTMSAWSSFMLYQQMPFKRSLHDNDQEIWPFVYLFVVLFLFISPLAKITKIPKNSIVFSHFSFLKWLMICVICFQVLCFVINIPSISNILNSGTAILNDYRNAVYDSSNSLVGKIPILNRFNLLYSGLKPICAGLSLVLLLCCNKYRKLTKLFFITTSLDVAMEIVIMVSRGILVNYIIYYSIILVLLREYISARIKRTLVFYCIPLGFAVFSFFWIVSVSRFGDLANYMVYKYLGEPMINFNGIMFDHIQNTTGGHAYFSTFYRYVFGDLDFITCDEKWDYIEHVTKIPPYIFYTFVGGLIIEFGKIGTVVIALLFFVIGRKVALKIDRYRLSYICIIFLLVYTYSYGVFVFPLQGFNGNFMILYTIIFYIIFKKKHENRHSHICKCG